MKILFIIPFILPFLMTTIRTSETISDNLREFSIISHNKTILQITLDDIKTLIENEIIEKHQAIKIWSLLYKNSEKEKENEKGKTNNIDLKVEEISSNEKNEVLNNNGGSYQILIILLIGGAIISLIILSIMSNLYKNDYIWSLIFFLMFCAYNLLNLSRSLIYQLELNFLASLTINISFFMIMTIIYQLLIKIGINKKDDGMLDIGTWNLIFAGLGLYIGYLFCFISTYPLIQFPFFCFLFLNCYLAGVKLEKYFKIIQPSYILFVVLLSFLIILNFLFYGNEIFNLPLKYINFENISGFIVNEKIINFVNFEFLGLLSSVLVLNFLPLLYIFFKFSDKEVFNYDEAVQEFKNIIYMNDLKIEFKSLRIVFFGCIVHLLLFLCLKMRLFLGFAFTFIFAIIFNSILLKSERILINFISCLSGFFMLNGVFLIDKYEDQFSIQVYIINMKFID
jgi:hypothetical protein